MKFLTRTVIALAVFNLAMGSFALAQNPPGEQIPEGSEPTAPQPVQEPTLPTPVPPKPTPGVAVSPPRPTAPTLPNQYPTRSKRFSGISGRKVLVVPAEDVKVEDLAEIMEDMQIMSYIFDGRFKETRRIQGGFIDFGDFFGRDNRATEAIYLQGYGVLFSMEVNFAFSPGPKQQDQQQEQTEEPVDSTWQRAKQQMFSPGDSRVSRGPRASEEYDSRMVEELKRDLITTLKHATNIRAVKPDEWIILTVIGSGRQAGGFGGGGFMMGGMGSYGGMMGGSSSGSGGSGMIGSGMGGMMGGGSGGMMGGGMGGGMGSYGAIGDFPTTVLTIRVKKSDVDAFAQSRQNYEDFRRKVQIFTY
jgi:hypothetical protein